jgi:hypothetical protein
MCDDSWSTMESPRSRLCRHFARGFCAYGADCRQLHDPAARLTGANESDHARATAAVQLCKDKIKSLHLRAAPREEILAAVAELGALKEEKRSLPRPRRRAAHDDERAGIFRRFLLSQYGAETLCSGSGVLDVAGGHGSLAFELVNIDGVPCTVIDPRPIERGYGRLERKWKVLGSQPWSSRDDADAFTLAARRSTEEEATKAEPTSAKARVLASRRVHLDWQEAARRQPACRRPGHWRLMWDANLYGEGVDECLDSAPPIEPALAALDQRIQALLQQARSLEWTRKGLVVGTDEGAAASEEDGQGKLQQQEETDVDERREGRAGSLSAAHACATLSNVALVAGMHADGATEGIVDFALRRKLPFAVVPCCVRPPSVPMSYPAFVRHLVAKAPGLIRTCVLPFEGKNVCVYSHGDPRTGPSSGCTTECVECAP